MNEKVKQHFTKHKAKYIVVGAVVIAGITWAIVRHSQLDQRGNTVLPRRGFTVPDVKAENSQVVNNYGSMGNVSYISANRQGPPSWVVRCLETGDIYTSQNSAAEAMGIQSSNLSKHLNGLLENAEGLHFERICLAA